MNAKRQLNKDFVAQRQLLGYRPFSGEVAWFVTTVVKRYLLLVEEIRWRGAHRAVVDV